MIVNTDQDPLKLNASGPPDAPPSYDSAVTGRDSNSDLRRAESSARPRPQPQSYPRDEKVDVTASPSSPQPSGSRSFPSSPVPPAKTPASWLGHFLGTSQARGDQEVRQTAIGLLRDLVKQDDDNIAITVLHSCAAACSSRGISFEAIVQEPSIQSHTPLYWAIVKKGFAANTRQRGENEAPTLSNRVTLFDLLLSYPFTKESYEDALQACLLTSSHETFMQLQPHNPNREDDILADDAAGKSAGASRLGDVVEVSNGEELSDTEENAMSGAFRVRVKLKDFQKRIRVRGSLKVEFIARGRMWSLTFLVYSPTIPYPKNLGRNIIAGTWIVLLDLVENSPPTWIDSKLTIHAPTVEPIPQVASANPFAFAIPSTPHKPKPPPIILRFRSPGNSQLSGDMKDKSKSWDNSRGPVMVSLFDNPQGGSLQYDGCPYIHEDGWLELLFEAKLVKPGNECVFM